MALTRPNLMIAGAFASACFLGPSVSSAQRTLTVVPQAGYAHLGNYFGPKRSIEPAGYTDVIIALRDMPWVSVELGVRNSPEARWSFITEISQGRSEMRSHVEGQWSDGGTFTYSFNRRERADVKFWRVSLGSERTLSRGPLRLDGQLALVIAITSTSVAGDTRPAHHQSYQDPGGALALRAGFGRGPLSGLLLQTRGSLIRTSTWMFDDLRPNSYRSSGLKGHWLPIADVSAGWRIRF